MKIYLAEYYDKEPIFSLSETKEIESDIIVNRIFNILKKDDDEDEDEYEIPDDEEIKQTYLEINKTPISKDILLKIKQMLNNQ